MSMKKMAISAVITAAIAIGMISAIATFTPSATAEYFYCSERQTFSAFNNIIVPEGQTCVLDQFNVVQGDIQVEQGASLYVYADNDIAGSIMADGAETVYLIDYVPPYARTMDDDDDDDDDNDDARNDDDDDDARNDDDDDDDVVILPPPPTPKARGLVILGSVDIQNTNNFALIGNPLGITIVQGDVTVQNTQNVEVIDVDRIGNLEISTSASCDVSNNVVSGSTELSGCSNLTN